MFKKLTSSLGHQMALWKESCDKLSVNEPETEIKFLLKYSWVWKLRKKQLQDVSRFADLRSAGFP